MRGAFLVLSCGGAAALLPAARPAMRPAVAHRSAPATMLDPSALLANAGAAVPIDATLIAQLGVSAGLIVGGFALEEFTEVEEEGIAQPEKKEGESDLYRDSLLRYCGYANEVGEAFRPLVPVPVVLFSYVIAITYILADTVDKGKKGAENFGGAVPGTLGAVDTFCWQMLASVLFPSFIINRAVLFLVSLQATDTLPDLLNAGWLPTVVGLVLIPAVIVPLDVLAHWTMNSSYRRIGKSVLGEP